ERGFEPEIVERLRPQLHRERPYALKGRDRELAGARQGGAAGVAVGSLLGRAQREQDRGQGLTGVVVELEGQPATLVLLRGDDAAERVARDPLREVDGDRSARREGLGETHIVV